MQIWATTESYNISVERGCMPTEMYILFFFYFTFIFEKEKNVRKKGRILASILGFCISLNSVQNNNPSSLPCFLGIFCKIIF